jgi:hypothetical protein
MALSTLSTTTYRAPKLYTYHCVHASYFSRHLYSATADIIREGRDQVCDPCIWLYLPLNIHRPLIMEIAEAGLEIEGPDCFFSLPIHMRLGGCAVGLPSVKALSSIYLARLHCLDF